MNRFYRRLTHAAQVLRYGETKQVTVIPARITEEDIRELKHFFPMDKFFIFGHARSGTTLLARLIRVHPAVHCNWQAHFFTRTPFLSSLVSDPEVREWLSRRSNRWNNGRDMSPQVMRAASDFILEREATQVGKTVVGDKSPNNLVNGGGVHRLAAIYPDAKLIFIVRDGRDAVLSHQFQKFIDLPEQLNAEESATRQALIKDPQQFPIQKRSVFSPAGLRTAARDWVQNVTETNQLGQELFAGAYLSIRFEDILANPHLHMKKVWEFLGVETSSPHLDDALKQELAENPDAEWQRGQQQQVADILRKGVPGSWRELFTADDVNNFNQIAGETLIEWGYEKDLNW